MLLSNGLGARVQQSWRLVSSWLAFCSRGWIEKLGHGVARHIGGMLDRPLVVPLQERGADQLPEGRFVGEDAHDIGAALDVVVPALDGVGLRPVRRVAKIESSVRARTQASLRRNRCAAWPGTSGRHPERSAKPASLVLSIYGK